MRLFIFIAYLCIIIGNIGCNNPNVKQNTSLNNKIILGKWTFIERNDSIIDYTEIDFQEGDICNILSESNGRMGPFLYHFIGDTFIFNNIKFEIITDSSGMLVIKHENHEYYLYKIPFNENDLDSNQINPFYLRRCYFLVHMKIINMNEAKQYLLDLKEFSQDSLPEEEIIPLN